MSARETMGDGAGEMGKFSFSAVIPWVRHAWQKRGVNFLSLPSCRVRVHVFTNSWSHSILI